MPFVELRNHHVTLLGVGKETLTVLPHLLASGVESISVVEPGTIQPDQITQLENAGIDAANTLREVPASGDVVLRSPGFPRHRPDVEALAQASSVMTTPTGLWLAERGGRGTVTVTGTKGKSTTATLISDGLAYAGVVTHLAGNIGTPPWMLNPDVEGTVIVELSSYHGADLFAAGEVGVLTTLTADHLDWHGSEAQYRTDKLRIVRAPQADHTPQTHRFALNDVELPGDLADVIERIDAHSNDHRDHNVALAVAAVNAELAMSGRAGVAPDELARVLRAAYPSLPGRFHLVATINGVDYVDDALGSNPTATAAALELLAPGPSVLICGGHDRHVPLDPIVHTLHDWPDGALSIVWLGAPDDARFQRLSGLGAVGQVATAPSLTEAVPIASQWATPQSTVVFSPLAPTERSEGSWLERSREFHEAVSCL